VVVIFLEERGRGRGEGKEERKGRGKGKEEREGRRRKEERRERETVAPADMMNNDFLCPFLCMRLRMRNDEKY
jgi:hypothetical protein